MSEPPPGEPGAAGPSHEEPASSAQAADTQARSVWWRRILGSGRSDQETYVRVAIIAIVVLYVVGFVVANSKDVSISLVLGSIDIPLLWLVLVLLALGFVGGWVVRGMRDRRRKPAP